MSPQTPYGLETLWSEGDIVIKSVAVLLICMSMASWYVIIAKILQLKNYARANRAARHAFWERATLSEGIATLGKGNPFAMLAQAGADAVHHHGTTRGNLQDQLPISDWVTLSLRQAIDETSEQMRSGLALLASVGSTAPFVGLFGTVWGIYHALVSIGVAGQASIDRVAGPVGEALIMTALGLAVAIPATFGYNALVRGNKTISAGLNKFGFDLHALFVTGSRTAANAGKNLPAVSKPISMKVA